MRAIAIPKTAVIALATSSLWAFAAHAQVNYVDWLAPTNDGDEGFNYFWVYDDGEELENRLNVSTPGSFFGGDDSPLANEIKILCREYTDIIAFGVASFDNRRFEAQEQAGETPINYKRSYQRAERLRREITRLCSGEALGGRRTLQVWAASLGTYVEPENYDSESQRPLLLAGFSGYGPSFDGGRPAKISVGRALCNKEQKRNNAWRMTFRGRKTVYDEPDNPEDALPDERGDVSKSYLAQFVAVYENEGHILRRDLDPNGLRLNEPNMPTPKWSICVRDQTDWGERLKAPGETFPLP